MNDSTTIRVKNGTREKLQAVAAGNNRPMSTMVDELISWWIKTHCPECGEAAVRSRRCVCKAVELL